jgi:hypothetical protein
MTQYAVGPQATQIWAGRGPVLLANQDLVHSVTIGKSPQVFIGSQAADVIPPLGSLGLLGHLPLYAIAPAGTAALAVIAGGTSWAPSPADVALQIQDLGLAKDTTLQALPDSLQAAGVPAFIPNLASAGMIGQGTGGGGVFHTFTGPSRIWYCHLSFAAGSNASYTGGVTQLYARVMAKGIQLPIVERAISGPQQNAGGDASLTINGLQVGNTDTLSLDVNNNAAMTQGVMHASCTVLFSVP